MTILIQNDRIIPAGKSPVGGQTRLRKRQARKMVIFEEEKAVKKADVIDVATAGDTSGPATKASPRITNKEKNPAIDQRTVGGMLQFQREKRKETIQDVADFLRIRASYLEALEQNRYRDLPGQVYVMGYARSYAQYLGLNAHRVVQQLKAEYLPYQRRPSQANSLVLAAPPQTRKRPGRKMMVGGIAVLIGGGIIISALMPPARQVKLSPGAGLPNNDVAALNELAVSPRAPSLPAPPARPAPPPAPAAGAAPAANLAAVAPAAAVTAGIVMAADANSWVQVKDGSGQIIYTKVMRAGESYTVPNAPGIKLTSGNLAGLHFTVNGQPLAPAGKTGMVARDIPLNPDALDSALHKFRGGP